MRLCISTLSGVMTKYTRVTLFTTLITKSHDPLSRGQCMNSCRVSSQGACYKGLNAKITCRAAVGWAVVEILGLS